MSEPKRFLSLLVVALGVGAVVLSSIAEAQRTRNPIERRLRPGQGFWANQRASRSLSHARDYSHGFYQYSQGAQTIQPQVARSETSGLHSNLNAARQELTIIRKEYASNPEVAKSVSVIEGHLTKAEGQHKTLHTACQHETIDGKVVMHCCNEITKEVDKAIAEHKAMMRHLDIKAKTDQAKDSQSKKGQ